MQATLFALLCTDLASNTQERGESESSAPAAGSHVPLAVTAVVLAAAVLTVGGFLLKRKLQEPTPYQIMWEVTKHLLVEGAIWTLQRISTELLLWESVSGDWFGWLEKEVISFAVFISI